MTDDEKQLVDTLRNFTKHCKLLARDPYLAIAGIMELSADMIEKLSADRDAWKRRAEAAECDINAVLRAHVDDLHCDQCKKGVRRWVCGYYTSDMCPDAEWRGPCKENEKEEAR